MQEPLAGLGHLHATVVACGFVSHRQQLQQGTCVAPTTAAAAAAAAAATAAAAAAAAAAATAAAAVVSLRGQVETDKAGGITVDGNFKVRFASYMCAELLIRQLAHHADAYR
jgi:hypothetical protein